MNKEDYGVPYIVVTIYDKDGKLIGSSSCMAHELSRDALAASAKIAVEIASHLQLK